MHLLSPWHLGKMCIYIDLSHFIMNFDVKVKIYILFTLFYFFGAKAESSNETFGNSYKEMKNFLNSYFIYHFISGSNHGGLWEGRHRY